MTMLLVVMACSLQAIPMESEERVIVEDHENPRKASERGLEDRQASREEGSDVGRGSSLAVADEQGEDQLELVQQYNVEEQLPSQTVLSWNSFSSSKKKTELARLWREAQRAEPTALVAEKSAPASSDIREEGIAWQRVIQQASKLRTAWTEIVGLYQREKEYPPYWIKCRWARELEDAENKKAFWNVKFLYCRAKEVTSQAYLAREMQKTSDEMLLGME